MENYWVLELKDGSKIDIPPNYVEEVNKRFIAKEVIPLRNRSIPFSEVKGFERTSRKFFEKSADTRLLEETAQAFREPMLTADGIQARWVKKEVTSDRWERYYSDIPGYKKVESRDGMVWIAWRQPIHQIDPNQTPECTASEVETLDNMLT